MRRFTTILALLLISMAVLAGFIFNGKSKPFTIIIMPDTQHYTEKNFGGLPEIFTSQTKWIKNHKDSLNIVHVIHVGDIVNRNTDIEWERADKSMGILDNVVPYSLAVGNHDMGPGGYTTTREVDKFNKTFPVERFKSGPGWGGIFQQGHMENCFRFFNAGGSDYMVLTLEFGPRNEVLQWADSIVTLHSKHRVIVSTHCYLSFDNTLVDAKDRWNPQKYGIMDFGHANTGKGIWEKFIKKHENIFLVVCGHIANDGAGQLISVGDKGNYVYQILSNYQHFVHGSVNGGNGFLRIMTFYPDEKRISVKTYSPFIDKFMIHPEHEFDIDLSGADFILPKS
jgi:hypothetical protein